MLKRVLSSIVAVAMFATMAITVSAADTVLFEGEESCNAWGQAVQFNTLKNDGGTLDPEIFTEGTTVVVEYTPAAAIGEDEQNIEIVFQSWTDGNTNEWAKVAPTTDDGKVATFTYADIVKVVTDDIPTYLDNFIVGGGHVGITVTKVYLTSDADDADDTADKDDKPADEKPATDKNPTTGVGGMMAVVGISALAATSLVVSKKRK